MRQKMKIIRKIKSCLFCHHWHKRCRRHLPYHFTIQVLMHYFTWTLDCQVQNLMEGQVLRGIPMDLDHLDLILYKYTLNLKSEKRKTIGGIIRFVWIWLFGFRLGMVSCLSLVLYFLFLNYFFFDGCLRNSFGIKEVGAVFIDVSIAPIWEWCNGTLKFTWIHIVVM